MFDIQSFRSALQFDGARPNLFSVSLTMPTNFNIPVDAQAAFKVPFMVTAASLPASTLGTVPVNYFGREIKVPGNRKFQDWTFTVINDEDFIIRNGFETWMNAINSHAGNIRDPNALVPDVSGTGGGYAVDGFIYQYGKTGPSTTEGFNPADAIKSYKFIGMWPVEVQAIGVDWSDDDSIEKFSVTCAYQWWESNTTDTNSAA